jgi:DNA-binding IclR family transcriptional regulator
MIFLSKWSSQTLCAGAELGVFDCLSRDGTRTANDVAAETGLDPTLLYRLLRALASLGLLHDLRKESRQPAGQFSSFDRQVQATRGPVEQGNPECRFLKLNNHENGQNDS